MRRWGRACQGEGQFVLIVGEAGLGKLACSKNFTAERDTPHTWTEWASFNFYRTRRRIRSPKWGRQLEIIFISTIRPAP
jgi:hypothetical protein